MLFYICESNISLNFDIIPATVYKTKREYNLPFSQYSA